MVVRPAGRPKLNPTTCRIMRRPASRTANRQCNNLQIQYCTFVLSFMTPESIASPPFFSDAEPTELKKGAFDFISCNLRDPARASPVTVFEICPLRPTVAWLWGSAACACTLCAGCRSTKRHIVLSANPLGRQWVADPLGEGEIFSEI